MGRGTQGEVQGQQGHSGLWSSCREGGGEVEQGVLAGMGNSFCAVLAEAIAAAHTVLVSGLNHIWGQIHWPEDHPPWAFPKTAPPPSLPSFSPLLPFPPSSPLPPTPRLLFPQPPGPLCCGWTPRAPLPHCVPHSAGRQSTAAVALKHLRQPVTVQLAPGVYHEQVGAGCFGLGPPLRLSFPLGQCSTCFILPV